MLWIIEHIDTLDPEAVLRFLPGLSEDRKAAILSMTNGSAQVRSVLAELLLRHALREEYGLKDLPRIEIGEKGKPFFPDLPDLHFNLSHCKTAVVCALDSSPVGVDVQEVRFLRRNGTMPSAPSVYRILSEKERAWVEAGQTPDEHDRRFTAVWTCKEAWGKALGVGFLYDLKTTEFLPRPEAWRQYGFTFQQSCLSDTVLTLCAAKSLPCRNVTFEDIRTRGKTMKHFLVVVDMQTDFIDGSLGSPAAVAIKPAVIDLIHTFPGVESTA